MPLHEEYPETPRILHIGDTNGVSLPGISTENASVERALESLDATECIVCEHGLPECDALAVLSEVRKRDSSLPFFVVSDDDETIAEAFSMDVTDCIGPEDRKILSHKIDRAVTGYRNERALSRANAVLEGVSDAVLTIDTEGTVRYANDGLERILGYDSKEIAGEPLTRVIPEQLESLYEATLSRYSETDERSLDWEHFETRARHRDGHEVPVTLSLRNVTDGDEELITGIVRDVSERKTVETELEASRERYRELVATSPEAILVADAETGKIVDANAAAEELLGRPRSEICKMYQWELHPRERQTHYRRIFERHAEEGGIMRNRDDLTVVRSDGEEVPVEISANRTRLDGRRVIHGIFKDVSERKGRERTLAYLRSATRELMRAETKADICKIAVEAAGDELGLPLSGIYLANDEEDVLRQVAVTETTEQLSDELPRFEGGEGLTWSAFESGEATKFDAKGGK